LRNWPTRIGSPESGTSRIGERGTSPFCPAPEPRGPDGPRPRLGRRAGTAVAVPGGCDGDSHEVSGETSSACPTPRSARAVRTR
jgi:hypothetical protein